MSLQQTKSTPALTLTLLFPAAAMSLGWAFRGFIGGGPLGAMIPGAMVAMVLIWILGRGAQTAGLVAAFGAVGIGLGGQMTYGQTVGFASDPQTVWWGLLGLTLKGAVWGLSGGAIVGLACTVHRYSRYRLAAGFAAMLAATWAGWRFVNHPKLVYFSHPTDRPREEVWAGLLAGAIALLLVMALSARNVPMLRFAFASFAGGGLGFGLGGALLALGRNSSLNPAFWPWWKGMEYTFGLLFGFALGWAAWRSRDELLRDRPFSNFSPPTGVLFALTVATIAAGIGFEYSADFRFNYSVIGVALLLVAVASEGLAWQIAITMTYLAFALDFAETAGSRIGSEAHLPGVAIALGSAVAVWFLVERLRVPQPPSVPKLFNLLLGTAFAVTTVKTLIQFVTAGGPHIEYLMFLAATVAVWRMADVFSRRAIQDRARNA